ncbi:16S rRNA (uracil(1498)-N(3))-methyltransferase [Nocardiopsis sp. CNT-189]|uniref:16S rRNA (uracil(1498)-N(3))-methyltransferase n=1 Tax=Nocardiopsis oceanisediminis TaxID=2816862 RepID=UPI003B35B324
MTAPVFLAEEGALDGARAVLRGPEGRHAATVRRISVGETVHLVDGAGTRARCTVAEVGKDTVVCEVLERGTDPEPAPRITVVQALPKGDRGELAVEMMTEAGVDRIVPWAAERCVTRWKPERAEKALAKWRAAAREAAKQSRRSRVPEVTAPAGTARVAELLGGAALGAVLHEEAAERLSALPLPDGLSGPGGGAVLVVGPEGGVSPDELSAFDAAGAVRVLLGPTVLRTSTAGVAALSVLQSRCGRW